MEALLCAECGRYEREFARGWCGFLTAGDRSPQEVAIFCPDCVERALGPPQFDRQADDEGDS